jgi:FAD/FMN-containing dehydrogenase
LIFPLDLAARGSCTIGGNIATNAGGVRVLRYGMMRSLVLGLEATLADGSVVTSLNKMLKNNAGYDLKQIFIGAEGTLGVVTRATLRLWPRPSSVSTALLAAQRFDQVVGLLELAQRAIGSTLASFEVMWNEYYRLTTTPPALSKPPLGQEHPFYVLLESLGGDPAGDGGRFEAALDEAQGRGFFEDGVVAKSQQQRAALWRIREDSEQVERQYKPAFGFDVSLPINAMQRYIEDLRQSLKQELGAVCWVFGHLADGNLHINVWAPGGDERAQQRVEELVYQPLGALGGSVSAEHGIGLDKRAYLHLCRSDAEIALMRRLKQALDPRNILNPGKVLPE